MTRREALIQLARILGREELFARLGPGGDLEAPGEPQLALLRSLAAARAQEIARALLEEAVACDDVTDPESAAAYLEDRLAFLGDLLSEETRREVREAFQAVARGWG